MAVAGRWLWQGSCSGRVRIVRVKHTTMHRTFRLTCLVACVAAAAGLWPPSASAIGARRAEVRVLVTPSAAAVYVDGSYAGMVDDFVGLFQRLSLPPGEHDVVLYLDGYRTVHQTLRLAPNATYKLRYTMEPLAPGEVSERPPAAPPVPPPSGPTMRRRTQRERPTTPSRRASPDQPSDFGTLTMRVQPFDADVTIDGHHWSGADGGERLMLHLVEGRHHVEVRKIGYRSFAMDIDIRRGNPTPLNVALTPDQEER
jgi:hypothetical protein